MALIRLAYAADLPPTDKLVRDLLDGRGTAARRAAAFVACAVHTSAAARAFPSRQRRAGARRTAPQAMPRTRRPCARWKTLWRWRGQRGAPSLQGQSRERCASGAAGAGPDRIPARTARAPRTLAGDLRRSSRTGPARAGWCPRARRRRADAGRTETDGKAARIEAVAQEPLVRAVLDRFPGAEIVAVRDVVADEIAPAMPVQTKNDRDHRYPGAPLRRVDGRLALTLTAMTGFKVWRSRLRDRTADPASRQIAGPWAAFGAARGAGAAQETRHSAGAAGRRHAEAAAAIRDCEICGNLDTTDALAPSAAIRAAIRMCCASSRMWPICGRWSGRAFSAAAIMCWAARCRRWMASRPSGLNVGRLLERVSNTGMGKAWMK